MSKTLEELLKYRATVKDEYSYYSNEFSEGNITIEERDRGHRKCQKELDDIKAEIDKLKRNN